MRALVLCVGLAAAPVAAAPLTSTYSSLLLFGDSLTDDGNVFSVTPGEVFPQRLPPSPPYFDGRFSNGPVWNEGIAAEFEDAGLYAQNFAFGLAGALGGLSVDFEEQRALFEVERLTGADPGPRPLASVWFGSNDVFGAVDGGADATAAAATGTQAAEAVLDGIAELSGDGVDDFLLFNLPDLGATPAYSAGPPAEAAAATAGAEAFNARLAQGADALRASGLAVTEVDIAGLFDALIADPAAFGFDDATTPCIAGGVFDVALGQADACASAEGLVFWDIVHPTAAVHRRIGEEARIALGDAPAAVPLPAAGALLAAAMGALALARSRRRR